MRKKYVNKVIIVSIIVLIALCIIGYFVLKNNNNNNSINNINNNIVSEDYFDIKQVYPSKYGYTVLFNDGTVYIYYNDNNIYSTQVYNVCAINQLIDANRGISKDGNIYVWSTDNETNAFAQALKIDGFKNIVAVSGDYYVRKNNENDYTVLMLDSDTEGALIEEVFTVDSFKKIVTDELYGYILKEDGTVWAWGNNTEGALGNGEVCTVNDTHFISDECKCSQTLVKVQNLENITNISLKVAVDNDGKVYTWGNNYFGTVGNGKQCQVSYDEHYLSDECSCAIIPYCISNINNAKSVYSNANQCYAICEDGIYTWGQKDISEINQQIEINSIPIKYNNLYNISNISTIKGENNMTVFISEDNSIYVSGYDSINKLYLTEPTLCSDIYPTTFIDEVITEIPKSKTIYAGESITFPNISDIECILSNGQNVRININGWYSNENSFDTLINGELVFYPSLTTNNYVVKDKSIFSYKVIVGNEMPQSINIIPPTKTEYYFGEIIDFKGGLIIATYLDGKTVTIPLSSALLSYNDFKVGENEVKVSIFGLEESFYIYVIDKSIVSVSLNTLPIKVTYKIGESVDTIGGTILVTYNNDEVECINITNDMIRNFDSNNAGTVTVIIDYMNYTFSYDIQVSG